MVRVSCGLQSMARRQDNQKKNIHIGKTLFPLRIKVHYHQTRHFIRQIGGRSEKAPTGSPKSKHSNKYFMLLILLCTTTLDATTYLLYC